MNDFTLKRPLEPSVYLACPGFTHARSQLVTTRMSPKIEKKLDTFFGFVTIGREERLLRRSRHNFASCVCRYFLSGVDRFPECSFPECSFLNIPSFLPSFHCFPCLLAWLSIASGSLSILSCDRPLRLYCFAAIACDLMRRILPVLRAAGKYFPIVSLAWSRGNPLWLLGFRAWQEKSENLFSALQ